jgi:transposase
LDRRCAPSTSAAATPPVIVLDNGPIHTSKLGTKALAARPWLTVEWLPKYAPELNDPELNDPELNDPELNDPELNDIERSWRDLKRHHLANRTFQSRADLDDQIHHAVHAMNRERAKPMCHDLRIAA